MLSRFSLILVPYSKTMSYATQISYCCINAAAAVIRGTNGGASTSTDGLVTELLIALAGVSRRKYVFLKLRVCCPNFLRHEEVIPSAVGGIKCKIYTRCVRIPTYVYRYTRPPSENFLLLARHVKVVTFWIWRTAKCWSKSQSELKKPLWLNLPAI